MSEGSDYGWRIANGGMFDHSGNMFGQRGRIGRLGGFWIWKRHRTDGRRRR